MSDPSNIRLRIHEDTFTEKEGILHYQCALSSESLCEHLKWQP